MHCPAQVRTLREAWGIVPGDRVLHTLPLHHVHGLVNALLCPLSAGATVEMQGAFGAGRAWEALKVRCRLHVRLPGGSAARRSQAAVPHRIGTRTCKR